MLLKSAVPSIVAMAAILAVAKPTSAKRSNVQRGLRALNEETIDFGAAAVDGSMSVAGINGGGEWQGGWGGSSNGGSAKSAKSSGGSAKDDVGGNGDTWTGDGGSAKSAKSGGDWGEWSGSAKSAKADGSAGEWSGSAKSAKADGSAGEWSGSAKSAKASSGDWGEWSGSAKSAKASGNNGSAKSSKSGEPEFIGLGACLDSAGNEYDFLATNVTLTASGCKDYCFSVPGFSTNGRGFELVTSPAGCLCDYDAGTLPELTQAFREKYNVVDAVKTATGMGPIVNSTNIPGFKCYAISTSTSSKSSKSGGDWGEWSGSAKSAKADGSAGEWSGSAKSAKASGWGSAKPAESGDAVAGWEEDSSRLYDFSKNAVRAGDIIKPQAICEEGCYQYTQANPKFEPAANCPSDTLKLPWCNGEEEIGDFCEVWLEQLSNNFNKCNFGDFVILENCEQKIEGFPTIRPVLERVDCDTPSTETSIVGKAKPICGDDCVEVLSFADCPVDLPVTCNGTQAIDEVCRIERDELDTCFGGFDLANCRYADPFDDGNIDADIVRVVECPSPSPSHSSSKSSKSGGSGSKSAKSSGSGSKPASSSWDASPDHEWESPPSVSEEAVVDAPADEPAEEEDPIEVFKSKLEELLSKWGGN